VEGRVQHRPPAPSSGHENARPVRGLTERKTFCIKASGGSRTRPDCGNPTGASVAFGGSLRAIRAWRVGLGSRLECGR
jgi:hypothetical protein